VLGKLDDLWLKVERVVVVAGFLAMSAVVFADVLHRVFADTAWQSPGRLVLVWGLLFGVIVGGARTASTALPRPAPEGAPPPTPVSAQASAAAPAAAELNATASPAEPPRLTPMSFGRAAAIGAGGTAGVALVAYGFVWLFPSGVIWAQKLALVLMLWVAFFGASIATRDNRHLKIDAAERLFKGPVKRYIGLLGNGVAALFCGALSVLAWRYCVDKYQLYVETEGAGGDFEGLPIPMFLAFAVLPISLAVMAARFVGHGVKSARGAPPPDTLHGISLPAGPPPEGERAS
jgi:TRAP-type C4-dicarboxylate transport system permease small subunit